MQLRDTRCCFIWLPVQAVMITLQALHRRTIDLPRDDAAANIRRSDGQRFHQGSWPARGVSYGSTSYLQLPRSSSAPASWIAQQTRHVGGLTTTGLRSSGTPLGDDAQGNWRPLEPCAKAAKQWSPCPLPQAPGSMPRPGAAPSRFAHPR